MDAAQDDPFLVPRETPRCPLKPRGWRPALTEEQAERIRDLSKWQWLQRKVEEMKTATVVVTGRRRRRRRRLR